MGEPNRPRIDFTHQERLTELALLKDIKDAKRYKDVYPLRLKEAYDNLRELYSLVEQRYRAGR